MKRLKIAVVHNTIAPYRHPLFELLSKNYDLTVYFCSIKHSLRQWELWPRAYNYRYKVLSGFQIKTSTDDISLNTSIIQELIKNRPDIVIISDYTNLGVWFTFIITKLLKIRIIYWTEGIKEPVSIIGKISRPLRTLFIDNAGSIVVPGKMTFDYVISLGADNNRVFVAPNCVDNVLFGKMVGQITPSIRQKNKDKYGLINKKTLLYVGQLTKRKGVAYLLKAFAELQKNFDNLALLIVGSGPDKEDLVKVVRSLGLHNVFFINSGKTTSELVNLYSIADIFVLPTLEDLWGFVINEAMLCGLPIVGTRASQAVREMVVNRENGFIVSEASVFELTRMLNLILTNNELMEWMRVQSKRIVTENFSVDCMAAGFFAAIDYVESNQR